MDGRISWGGDRRGKGTVFGVNLWRPIVTNGDFVAQSYKSDALFTNYFGEDVFYSCWDYVMLNRIQSYSCTTVRHRPAVSGQCRPLIGSRTLPVQCPIGVLLR